MALARADVVVPDLPGEFGARVTAQAGPLGARHALVRVGVDGLDEALGRCPAPLSTMGRGLAADGAYFLAAAAAGRHAAALLRSATMSLLTPHPEETWTSSKLHHLPQRMAPARSS